MCRLITAIDICSDEYQLLVLLMYYTVSVNVIEENVVCWPARTLAYFGTGCTALNK